MVPIYTLIGNKLLLNELLPNECKQYGDHLNLRALNLGDENRYSEFEILLPPSVIMLAIAIQKFLNKIKKI